MGELKNYESNPITEILRLPVKSDSPDMVNVQMNTWGVTRASAKHPVIKTIGLGPCVAVVLYDPGTLIAGLLHMTAAQGVNHLQQPRNDILNMLSAMQRNGVSIDSRAKIQAHLVGGDSLDDLAKLAQDALSKLGITTILTNIRAYNQAEPITQTTDIEEKFPEIKLPKIKEAYFEHLPIKKGPDADPVVPLLISDSLLKMTDSTEVNNLSIAFDSRDGNLFRLESILPGSINEINRLIALAKSDLGANHTPDQRTLK